MKREPVLDVYKTGSVSTNVTLFCVRATFVVEKQYAYYDCVCVLFCPACSVHAPYYIAIRGLSNCTIFFTLSH
jgi:hypothetical protein